MAPIVRISNLEKYFGRLHVLKQISVDVASREVVCIIGRSGSGKSTLLRCINFLEEPSFGTIEVDGLAVAAGERGKEHRQLVHDIRLKTGMVFQEFNLFPHMSVLENVIEARSQSRAWTVRKQLNWRNKTWIVWAYSSKRTSIQIGSLAGRNSASRLHAR